MGSKSLIRSYRPSVESPSDALPHTDRIRRRRIHPYSVAMTLVVNGEPRSIPAGASVADLVRELGLEKAACAVEVNKRLVPKADHPRRPLGDGDTVEVVTLVGGG